MKGGYILISKGRIKIVFCGIIFCFLFLAFKLGQIQIGQHQFYLKKSKGQKYVIPSNLTQITRGNIYDRKGRELAVSIMVDSCYAVPYKIKNRKTCVRKLCSILNLDYKKTVRKLKSHKSFVWIKRKLDPEIVEEIKKENLAGICFIKEEKRFYPQNELACQVIGVAGLDNQGLAGIEYYFDSYLKRKGKKNTETGKKVVDFSGHNVVLTIDKVIQYIAEKELKKTFINSKSKAATIVVQNIKTGEILAMANYPNFNPNRLTAFNVKHLKSAAVSDIFEPGSTFKMVTAAASLEEGTVKRKEKIFCENGKYYTKGFYIHDHEKEEWLTFDEVMKKSSNIGMSKVAFRMKNRDFYKYVRNFGFGNLTGIDLPNEVKGILSSPKRWSKRSLSSISFGQEIGVTAIQLISAFSCIANSGVLMQPRIVKCVVNARGEIAKEFKPVKVREVVSSSTAEKMVEILEGVVKDGTGTFAAIHGYRVAGKTGTAQKINVKTNNYEKNKYVSSFVGFLPLNDPQIAILVIFDESKKDYWGGVIAAPVFSRVGSQIMNYLNIPREKDSGLFFQAEKELMKDDKIKGNT